MTEIKMNGQVSKDFPADEMTVRITFFCDSTDSSEAISQVRSQCERFLEDIRGYGFSQVVFGSDSIERNYGEDSKITARRSLTIKAPADTKNSSAVLETIEKNGYSAETGISFNLVNIEGIKKELISLAVTQSRLKAEAVAKTVGEKITGVKEIVDVDFSDVPAGNAIAKYSLAGESADCTTPLTDSLTVPKINMSSAINVVWYAE